MTEKFKTFPAPGHSVERCVQCKEEIPAFACQQGQLIDHVWYPLHIGCADIWCAEEIPVWQVDWDGDYGHVEADLETILAYVRELDPGEPITIERRSMRRIEYLKLPDVH